MNDYSGVVESVWDGDTLTLDVHAYDKIRVLGEKCRMNGYNAVSLGHTLNGITGKEARDKCRSLLPVGSPCIIYTFGREKYGRMLTIVINHEGFNVNQTMIALGYGVPYDGTGPRAWADGHTALRRRLLELTT